MPTVPKPPTGEVGKVIPQPATWSSLSSLAASDRVPELRWPLSVRAYEQMMDDAQIEGLYGSTTFPLLEYKWWLDPNGADEATTSLLAEDLGLPVGEPQDGDDDPVRLAGRFDFSEHLMEALFAPIYGHYYFEVVGEDIDRPGAPWTLRKLSPRAPQTLQEIKAQADGGLLWIKQKGASFNTQGATLFAQQAQPINVDRLVAYVWSPTATRRWIGRSIIRSLYRNWLCKDVLIRVDVTNHERAGGIPYVRTDETWNGTSLSDLAQLAQDVHVTENGGAALPPGAWLELLRAGGTNVIDSARYHDEQMAMVWQQQVRMLGSSQSGNRALGEVMMSMEAMFRRSVASWFLRTFNRHVIGKWWTFNVDPLGLATAVPVVRCLPPSIETSSQDQPSAGSEVPAATVNPPSPPAAVARRARRGARPVRAALPDRQLRRDPYPHEVQAAVDFATLDQLYEDHADRLHRLFLDEWLPDMLDSLEQQIGDATGEAGLAAIRAPTTGVDDLTDALLDAARSGSGEALSELVAQGASGLDAIDDDRLRAAVADHAAAVARMVADGVSLASSRRAVQLSAGAGSRAEVATGVRSYVEDLTHTWERDQLAGAVQQGINVGRAQAFEQVEAVATVYSSELLDTATCEACRGIDGHEYPSLEHGRRDYASGGFVDCYGGPRCRGTLISVLADDT